MSFRAYLDTVKLPRITQNRVFRNIQEWIEEDRYRTEIVSHSLYAFDLTSNLLTIEDNDYFLMGKCEKGFETFFEKHRYLNLKNIRADIDALASGVFRLDENLTQESQLTKGTRLESLYIDSIPTKIGEHDLLSVRLYLNGELPALEGQVIKTTIIYKTELNRKSNDLLFFTGAIQPSDYKDANLLFKKIGRIAKCVEMRISNDKKFYGVIQSGDDRTFSPPIQTSRQKKDGNVFELQKTVFKNISSLEGRASYFSVFATTHYKLSSQRS